MLVEKLRERERERERESKIIAVNKFTFDILEWQGDDGDNVIHLHDNVRQSYVLSTSAKSI